MRGTVIACTAVLGSCFSLEREPPQTARYVLDARRPPGGESQLEARAIALEVPLFHVAPAYAGRQLVYRIGESEVETDFYHEFLIPPSFAFGELTRDWLSASGRFATARAGGRALADWVVEGDVRALFADLRDAKAPVSVVAVHVAVVDRATSRVVLEKDYDARVPVASDEPHAFVAGWNEGIATVLGALEADLGAAAARR